MLSMISGHTTHNFGNSSSKTGRNGPISDNRARVDRGDPLAERPNRGRASRPGPAARPNASQIDPGKVVQAFNTWAFKREQPDDADGLLRVVSAAVRAERPVPFVLYWGKGPRHSLAAPDLECLDYLTSFRQRIEDRYAPGAAVTLIFTDTHVGHNGHRPEAISAYFDAIAGEAEARGFRGCRLSTLVRELHEAGIEADPTPPSPDMLESLKVSAAKWYRGEGSIEQGAVDYYKMNMVEKRAVEEAFGDAVFLTFNGGEFRSLFPERMPVFYMYSLRRGFGVKPWFLSGEASEPVAG